MALLRIDEFTDPACPWAWSAEPSRRRIDWLYGDQVSWRLRMVGLAETPEEYLEKGFTTEKLSAGLAAIAERHGMPMDARERPRMAATVPACRAVVAAREHAGEAAARRLLRALRVRHFAGELLDDEQTIRGAARDAGLDGAELARWCGEEAVERALRADMAAAREPAAAAEALAHKLAPAEDGLRYTCPSYEVTRLRDGRCVSVPGFQPWETYDVVLANLVPEARRRDEPASVQEVLAWAGEPLATAEVAALCGLSPDEAREALGSAGRALPLGQDALWEPARYSRGSRAPSSERASATTASASPS